MEQLKTKKSIPPTYELKKAEVDGYQRKRK